MTRMTLTPLELRRGLVERLKQAGYLRTPRLERAFVTVPRHAFAPKAVSPEEAYRDEVIPLVPGLATVSQPSIVALMLEELVMEEGMRVLEVGTASGFNAALLAEVAGNPRLVYTIEIDPVLTALAGANLEAAGYAAIHLREGDGSLGWPEAAPFDRIILTAEAADLSEHLLGQLAYGGVLLAPFAVPGLPGLLLRLEKGPERVVGRFVGVPVSFVPLRGAYGEEGQTGDQGKRLRAALQVTERRAWEETRGLSLAQRMALALVVAAYSEETEDSASDVAAAAWNWFAGHDLPQVSSLFVTVWPLGQAPHALLGFRRRDYAFGLELAGKGIPPAEENHQGGRT